MDIPLSSPDIDENDRAAVLAVLQSPQLSLGPRLAEFESALARVAGAAHAVAVNSGTSALHLCVKAAGIGEGDELITTPFSFVASANCALFERAVPQFVDIDERTLNLDPGRIEAAITPRTRAILPVHVFGRPCRMAAIGEIARRRGLAVIEDACEAIGARCDGRPAGGLGTAGAFAFYPNKQITTGEGGAVLTNERRIAELCRSWRNQGRGGNGWLVHERLGFNYRLSDLQCALGISQLQRLEAILAARARAAALYCEALAGLPQLALPAPADPGTVISWFVYVVRLADEYSAEQRDGVLAELRRRGIGASDYFRPIHLQPLYRRFGYRPGDFPIAERVARGTLALPFFTRISSSDIARVCDTLRQILSQLRTSTHAFPLPASRTA